MSEDRDHLINRNGNVLTDLVPEIGLAENDVALDAYEFPDGDFALGSMFADIKERDRDTWGQEMKAHSDTMTTLSEVQPNVDSENPAWPWYEPTCNWCERPPD